MAEEYSRLSSGLGLPSGISPSRGISGSSQPGAGSYESHNAAAGSPFQKGQSFRGQITNITPQEITLELSDGRTMSASYENGTGLRIGDSTRFIVMSMTGSQIVLKALSADSAYSADSAILKALDNAALPVNDKNLLLVRSLLKYNMPINREMLTGMLTTSYKNPDISIDNLITMVHYNLPIDPDTTRSFENFSNLRSQLTGYLMPIIQDVTDTVESLVHNASGVDAASFLSEFFETFDIIDRTEPLPYIGANGFMLMPGADPESVPANAAAQKAGNLNPFIDIKSILFGDRETRSEEAASAAEGEEAVTPGIIADTGSSAISVMPGSSYDISAEEAFSYLDYIRENVIVRDFTSFSENGTSPSLSDIASATLQAMTVSEDNVVKHPTFRKLIGQLILDNWTLEISDYLNKDSIRDLYKRMNSQLNMLAASEGKLSAEFRGGALHNTIANMKQSLNLMNALNNAYAYVQLPIRKDGQTSHAELFVYTNPKKLRSKGSDTLSCLLRLNMAHLGKTDVHITLNGTNVTTKFTLEDEAAARIISEHLPELDAAVSKQGLKIHSLVSKINKEEDVSRHFDSTAGTPGDDIETRRYSFDVRA